MAFVIKTSTPEEIERIKRIQKNKIPSIDFDTFVHVFKGKDLIINNFTLHHPTVEEIIEFGEEKYLHLISLITMRAYDEKVTLFEANLDYEEISDFDIFIRNIRSIPVELSSIIFKDIPLNQFQLLINKETEEPILALVYNDITYIIDKTVYAHIVTFCRRINFVSNKIEYNMADEMGKKFLIERTKAKNEFAKKAKERKKTDVNFDSHLMNICSFVVSKGLYTAETVYKLKIGTLQELYHRLESNEERDDFSATLRTGFMKKEDVHKNSYKLNSIRSLYE